MSQGSLAGHSLGSVPLNGKRIRQPSQYTANIRKLNEEYNERPRRMKSSRNPSDRPSSDSHEEHAACIATLKCVLPSTQSLRVSIMLRKVSPHRVRTARKDKPKKKHEPCTHPSAPVEQEDLAAKFLNAALKLDNLSKQPSEGQSEKNQVAWSGVLRQAPVRLEKDINSKFLRLYERAEQLIHCFETSTLVEI